MPRPRQLAAHSRTIFAVLVSVVSLGGCVWWATKQEAPDFPSSAGGLLLILAAVLTYGLATLIRGWRWHMILRHAKIDYQQTRYGGLPVVLRRERRAEEAGEARLLSPEPEPLGVPVER